MGCDTTEMLYNTVRAGFLVMSDLKRKVQWLEAVQKTELGLELTLPAQLVIVIVLLLLLIQPFKHFSMTNSDWFFWYSLLQNFGHITRSLIGLTGCLTRGYVNIVAYFLLPLNQ